MANIIKRLFKKNKKERIVYKEHNIKNLEFNSGIYTFKIDNYKEWEFLFRNIFRDIIGRSIYTCNSIESLEFVLSGGKGSIEEEFIIDGIYYNVVKPIEYPVIVNIFVHSKNTYYHEVKVFYNYIYVNNINENLPKDLNSFVDINNSEEIDKKENSSIIYELYKGDNFIRSTKKEEDLCDFRAQAIIDRSKDYYFINKFVNKKLSSRYKINNEGELVELDTYYNYPLQNP